MKDKMRGRLLESILGLVESILYVPAWNKNKLHLNFLPTLFSFLHTTSFGLFWPTISILYSSNNGEPPQD
ncbi:unnamed protein product [Sphenostylis stenocarpa]|uniref:Uncharacterized protein n=1 Tax=Sphenostylis stenocarpa TaxID=92480 RepID=A0AA87B9I2_9FABA|nr:unnamed protein product [Sphenostylis stenocarpa]